MSEINVEIPTQNNSYPILIADDVLENISTYVQKFYTKNQVAIITDENIFQLYGTGLRTKLEEVFNKVEVFNIPAGEESKNWLQVSDLARRMIRAGFDRSACVLALGGGVVGDLAGFVASVFMRGIPFIQIPTSLLAMVDSSVGGKTGVDVPEGKNLLGSFYQPLAVLIDPDFLQKLPEREVLNGLAEIIKYGIIRDSDLFEFIEKNVNLIQKRDRATFVRLILDSVKIKAQVVSDDEKEGDLRKILNFGHTYGHAVEALSDFELPHGLAVAIGIHFACFLAEDNGWAKTPRIVNLFKKLGLPIYNKEKYSAEEILKKMKSDKKTIQGKINFVLPVEIGQTEIKNISDEFLLTKIKNFQKLFS